MLGVASNWKTSTLLAISQILDLYLVDNRHYILVREKKHTFWSSHEFIRNLWGEEGYVVLWLKQCFQTVLEGY